MKGKHVLVAGPTHLGNTTIGDYTYISQNTYDNYTSIGKFCSIEPNLVCGWGTWGTHPTNGISAHPMFFSTKKQKGYLFSKR